jgi:hypothetical protein
MAWRRRAVPFLCGTVLAALAAGTWPREIVAQSPQPTSGPTIVVRDAGPGVVGPLLRDAIARPHAVIAAPDTGIVLPRDTALPTTAIVLRGPVRLEGRVHGDLIALGDIVLRPGAVIEGRAIAIGGVIVNSALATVRGARLEFRDVTFDVVPTGAGAFALDYRLLSPTAVPLIRLPGVFGVRIPAYDRIDGLSLTFGPEIGVADGRVVVEPTVTYRSHLGELDPGARLTFEPTRRSRITLDARRNTWSNDRWIRGDILNSGVAFGAGADVRNYYRADRAELKVERDFESTTGVVTPYVGALTERAWSVARDSTARSAPYSILARRDREEGMLRPNPAIDDGRITSLVLGAGARVLRGPITASASARAEIALASPNDARFEQITVDGTIGVPTFRDQRFLALAHLVTTLGDRPRAQRFAYIGGGGTIPTMDVLSQGGDELAWLESRYVIPISRIHVPFAGAPTITLRHIVGGAGIDRLPTFTQNVGLRVAIGFLRVDFLIDPADTHRHDAGVGFGFR